MDTLLKENRKFNPPFKHSLNFQELYSLANENHEKFWEKQANCLDWFSSWKNGLIWNPPWAQWFVGGKLNAAYNCLDRHLKQYKNKNAIIWENERGESQKLTYGELHQKVCQLSHALEFKLHLKPGDTAAIYMPLIPEAIIAILACARIGVVHNVIFAGFSQTAICDRVIDSDCKVVITSDCSYRKGSVLDLKKMVEGAMSECPQVQHIIVFQRKDLKENLKGRYLDWSDLVSQSPTIHKPKPFDAEHPLFILYTSGTTGKPKGVLHSTGGYLVGTCTTAKWVFDLNEKDIYWCTADIGWVTGHSYVVYGILSNAATLFIYEGALNFPSQDQVWKQIEKNQITILYTAPTAIRAWIQSDSHNVSQYSMKSLKLLGSVGEPINPEAWVWYYEQVGKSRCPIVDTWWQTETGAIMIAPIPGYTELKPGSATQALPGIVVGIRDEKGNPCKANQGGYLVIEKPWPSMLRTVYKDPKRYVDQYWTRFPGKYFTGDGANCDEDGYFWIKGRVDDVLNVSGHRLGTMEIESALVSHPQVAEAAVVGRKDPLKGQAIVAFVILKNDSKSTPTNTIAVESLEKDLKAHVVRSIGSIARPDEIRFTPTLPKTRSGKIMRRLLKDLAEGNPVSGDLTTLEPTT